MRRPHIPFLFFLCLFGLVGSCDNTSCGCDPVPRPALFTSSQLVHKWQLDAIVIANQPTSTGSGIKDRYTIDFSPAGTYVQTLLADGTTFNGTWSLSGNENQALRLIDHKNATHVYTITQATGTHLRYGHINKDNKLEEYLFSLMP